LFIIMAVGVIAMSSASIFIRWALVEGVPPLGIAAYRLTIATLVLTIPMLRQRAYQDYAKLEPRQWMLLVGSGVLLALHFAAWITSLANTSVLSSVVLVTTTPLWIGMASPLLLHEHSPKTVWVGLVVAMFGGALIGLADLSGTATLTGWGDLLALCGAVFAAGYLMIGRGVRAHLSFVAYVWLVYGVAAVVLICWALLARTPLTGYSMRALLWLAAVALIPQLIGHTAANYVLRHVSATLVGISVLGEPIGSAALAIVFLGEHPGTFQLIGGAVILAGIGLASLTDRRDRQATSEATAADLV
jgi:drug/metabolite transporter (DMT)-like permease